MTKPSDRTTPTFIVLDETDTNKKLVLNTHQIVSFSATDTVNPEGEESSYILTTAATFIVQHSPAQVLARIYDAEYEDHGHNGDHD